MPQQDPVQTTLDDQALDVLRLVAMGRKDSVIANELNISPRTVQRRLKEIRGLLDVSTSTEAVVWAVRRGLL